MTAEPPDFDADAAYPTLRRLKAALAAGDWPAVRAIDAEPRDPDSRSTLLELVGDVPGTRPLLHEVLDRDPDDALAAALLGSHLIKVAWRARTSYGAKYVSNAQFTSFRDHLCRAEQVLIDGAARTPDDPALWSQRLTTARGLELGRSENRRRYDHVAALDPHHLTAQNQLLQSLCPKWGGTWEEMHAFASERAAAAPAGAPNAVLVVTGHVEQWLAAGRGAAPRSTACPP